MWLHFILWTPRAWWQWNAVERETARDRLIDRSLCSSSCTSNMWIGFFRLLLLCVRWDGIVWEHLVFSRIACRINEMNQLTRECCLIECSDNINRQLVLFILIPRCWWSPPHFDKDKHLFGINIVFLLLHSKEGFWVTNKIEKPIGKPFFITAAQPLEVTCKEGTQCTIQMNAVQKWRQVGVAEECVVW